MLEIQKVARKYISELTLGSDSKAIVNATLKDLDDEVQEYRDLYYAEEATSLDLRAEIQALKDELDEKRELGTEIELLRNQNERKDQTILEGRERERDLEQRLWKVELSILEFKAKPRQTPMEAQVIEEEPPVAPEVVGAATKPRDPEPKVAASRRGHPAPIDEETRAKIVSDYVNGVSAYELARLYPVSQNTVLRWVREAGHPTRFKSGGAPNVFVKHGLRPAAPKVEIDEAPLGPVPDLAPKGNKIRPAFDYDKHSAPPTFPLPASLTGDRFLAAIIQVKKGADEEYLVFEFDLTKHEATDTMTWCKKHVSFIEGLRANTRIEYMQRLKKAIDADTPDAKLPIRKIMAIIKRLGCDEPPVVVASEEGTQISEVASIGERFETHIRTLKNCNTDLGRNSILDFIARELRVDDLMPAERKKEGAA